MKNSKTRSKNKSRQRNSQRANKDPNIKPWIITAINNEERKSPDRLWKNEPSAESQKAERLKRSRFLRKHEKTDPALKIIADCLEPCEPNNRCYSGACTECQGLVQRFYVRQSKSVIRDIIAAEGQQLIALSIILPSGLVRPGQLNNFNIANYQRRIKSILDSVGIKSAIGSIDISFNEDRENKWPPYICLHTYLITATNDKEKLKWDLAKSLPKSIEVPRPVKVSLFENNAYRRSYSFKFDIRRRIGHMKIRKGESRKSRNTSYDDLLVDQRIELYKYLHQIGLAARLVFRGIKPEVSKAKVKFRKA